jgi:nodulation protein E
MTGIDIVITGRGVVSALGHDIVRFENALFAGECAISSIEDINDELVFKTGAPIRDFDASCVIDKREQRLMDPFSQFGVCGARQALDEAQFDCEQVAPTRLGVVFGTACGGVHTFESQYNRLYKKGQRKVLPMTVPMIMGSAPSSHVAKMCQARGPVFSVTSACASFNHALSCAISLLRDNMADMVVCGGTDANFAHGNLKGWEALHAVSPDTCRPFSLDRKGLSLGEGAGVFVLERRKDALARGVKPLASVLSVGMSSDAGNLVAPDARGMSAAMENAVNGAGISLCDIDYINAHGTGTEANDRTESQAIRNLFGDLADDIAVSSTKSQLGHALGASGAFELLATLSAMEIGKISPTVNFTTPDPNCPLDVVANKSRDADVQVALSNSFAFGGLNASVLVAKL